MFGLYRRCGSSKDTISVNGSDNDSSINTFINSSNINTIPSSILYNRTHRSANVKIMNVLLLLFLVFGSSVVSFGTDKEHNEYKKNNNNKYDEWINTMNIINKNTTKCIYQPMPCKALLLFFVPGLITGIGGYDNTWKPLKENWGLYWFRSNLGLAYGLNKRIYNGKYIDVDLHILGFNLLSLLGALIIYIINLKINPVMSSENFLNQGTKTWQDEIAIIITNFFIFLIAGTFQFLDFEIKVFKYWSISLNLWTLWLAS